MGRLVVRDETKARFVAFARQGGFRNFDEALSFLLDYYERSSGRRILVTDRDWNMLEVEE